MPARDRHEAPGAAAPAGSDHVAPDCRGTNLYRADHGFRSLTGLPKLKINEAPLRLLQQVPGIGAKRAATIFHKRPFKSEEELLKIVEDRQVLDFIEV